MEVPNLTLPQYNALQVHVVNMQNDPANPLTKTVNYQLSYMGETTVVSSTFTSKKQRDKMWYVTRAFRKLRKDVRSWIHAQEGFSGSISFGIDEINGPDVSDTDE